MSRERGETIEQLVAWIKAGEDVAGNMGRLYVQVRAFIRSMAWDYRGHADLEDLEQEGALALYTAIDNYDPAAGCLFLTYAGSWIRQAMSRYAWNNCISIRIPEHERVQVWQYQKLEKAFWSRMGRGPSDQEAAYHLGVTRQQVLGLKKSISAMEVQSLDGRLGEDGESTLGDIIPGYGDVEKDVLERMEQQQLKAVLWEEVDSLPDNMPCVLHSIYQEGRTLKQTGEAIGATPGRVQAMKQKALKELGRPRHIRKLSPFLPEAVASQAYRHNGVGEFDRTWTSSTERAALKLIKQKDK